MEQLTLFTIEEASAKLDFIEDEEGTYIWCGLIPVLVLLALSNGFIATKRCDISPEEISFEVLQCSSDTQGTILINTNHKF